MSNKYEFTGKTKEWSGITLRQIRATIAFGFVDKGEIGGWIEKEENLSQVYGNAWVYGNAQVYGDARVYGNARISGDARVYGNAWVYGNARISGDAQVYGDARVYGNAQVYGDARVYGDAAINILTALGYCLTIHADSKIKMRFNVGCFSGSRKEFVARAKQDKIPAKAVKAALALADATIKVKP